MNQEMMTNKLKSRLISGRFSLNQHWAQVASAAEDVDSHLPLLHPDRLPGSDERAGRDTGGEADEAGREGPV